MNKIKLSVPKAPTNSQIKQWKVNEFNTTIISDEIEEKLLKKVVLVKDTSGLFSPWLKIFKSSIIKENSLKMDENMSFGEDMLFVLSYIPPSSSTHSSCL